VGSSLRPGSSRDPGRFTVRRRLGGRVSPPRSWRRSPPILSSGKRPRSRGHDHTDLNHLVEMNLPDTDVLEDHGDGMGIRLGKGLLWAIGRRGDRHQPELMGVQHRGRRGVRRALQPNPVADPAEPRPAASGTASTTDPDAAWAVKWGRAARACYNNYLIDMPRRVIHHLRDGGGVRGPRSRRWSRVVVVSVCGTASNPHHRRDESRRGHPGLCGLSESRGC